VPGVPIRVEDTILKTSSDGLVQFRIPAGNPNIMSVPALIDLDNSTRLAFDSWSDGNTDPERIVLASENVKLTGSYRVQYLLQVNSLASSFSEWHDVGAKAKLQQPMYLPMEGLLGQLGGRYVFVGWSGDTSSSARQIEVPMDAPKRVNAIYAVDLGSLVLPITLMIGLVGGATLALYKSRKRLQLSPSGEWPVIVCRRCGREAQRGWAYCADCGESLPGMKKNE
jgi:hypothetical protein